MDLDQCAIVGYGGFGREVAALIEDIPTLSVAGFFDDSPDLLKGPLKSGHSLLGSTAADMTTIVELIVAIGDSRFRRNMVKRLTDAGAVFAPPVIHPMAWIGPSVRIGRGSVICANTSITTSITIGAHVHVNINATVGHDSVLADYVTLSPGVHISGNVSVGEAAELGTGAVVLPGVDIGAAAKVGAGAVVTSDVAEGATVVGMPAKEIGRR